jgi:hypothetical protein
MEGEALRGGVRVLRRQARCPVRAFCEDRLHARELARVATGFSARARGTATHRALEWLLEDLPEQGALREKLGLARSIAERALAAELGDARRFLRGLFAIEAERLAATLASLIEVDLRRAPFRVKAVEARQEIVIAGKRLSVRIDRLDEIAGGLAVIDYKTSENASSSDWLKERLRDAQVPLYAAHATTAVGAAAIGRVRGGRASYSGVWSNGEFPSKAASLPEGRDWPSQLARWHVQIEQLVRELAAGDTRIFVYDVEEARGQYAPLTRVDEQLALARGAAARW